jgi:hypothetical protein
MARFATIDDLKFIGAKPSYEKEFKEIADAAIMSCKRHLCYLAEELVVLCIFNENLSDTT